MNPLIATFVCACGIAGLFYFDRDASVRTSRGLWIPVIYLWTIGSRPLSFWLGTPANGNNVQLDGSPTDAAFFALLLIAAIGILINRRGKLRTLLVANGPILVYFVFCLISACWSDHPDVSLKRWIKATNDLFMALIVVTDVPPAVAIKRLISRVGFILLPVSVLFIKYYGDLGRAYSPDGSQTTTGVTDNKNTLGVVLLIVSLGAVWNLITLLQAKRSADRRRHILAQGVLPAFGLVLLHMAVSATSLACFLLGSGLVVVTTHRSLRGKAGRVRLICSGLVLAGALTFFVTGQDDVANALGRDSTLSGRTEIWAALIPTVPNSIIGAGFESYWISTGPLEAWHKLSLLGWWHPEILVPEAHNGYIEIFLNLGWVGVGLISLVLITGYRRALDAFRLNPSVGSLTLAYIMASAIYSITEAGFRPLDPIWVFLLLSILTSTAVTTGIIRVPSPVRVLQNSQPTDEDAGHDDSLPEIDRNPRKSASAPWLVSFKPKPE